MIAAACAALSIVLALTAFRGSTTLTWRRSRRPAASGATTLVALLERTAVEVRTGSSARAALAHATRTVETVPAWIDTVLAQCDGGAALADALRAATVEHADEALLRQALVGASTMGGASGVALDRAAAVLREREVMRDERRAWGAQARLSARVLTIVPVAFGGWMLATNRATRGAAFGSSFGVAALVAGAASNAIGWWWMRRIIGARR